MTDAERLRIALVNLLVNARHAVNGSGGGAGGRGGAASARLTTSGAA